MTRSARRLADRAKGEAPLPTVVRVAIVALALLGFFLISLVVTKSG